MRSRVQLAFYRGPGTTWDHKLSHFITVAVLTARTRRWCPYSHVELVIDGRCYSSSERDGGVRSKDIDLSTGRWHIIDVLNADADAVLTKFAEYDGLDYDWPGALRWGLPFLKQRPSAYYCFELVAHLLGLSNPSEWDPLELIDFFS